MAPVEESAVDVVAVVVSVAVVSAVVVVVVVVAVAAVFGATEAPAAFEDAVVESAASAVALNPIVVAIPDAVVAETAAVRVSHRSYPGLLSPVADDAVPLLAPSLTLCTYSQTHQPLHSTVSRLSHLLGKYHEYSATRLQRQALVKSLESRYAAYGCRYVNHRAAAVQLQYSRLSPD